MPDNLDTFSLLFLDITPPTFTCPSDIVTNTEPNLHYAVINISLPFAEGMIQNFEIKSMSINNKLN